MRKILFLVTLALAGCSGTTVQQAVSALAGDKANACLTVQNAYPPFAQSFTYIHQGDATQAAPSCK